jgi:hypothetical protein
MMVGRNRRARHRIRKAKSFRAKSHSGQAVLKKIRFWR